MFNHFYIHSGIGYGNSYLTSFDQALLHAGVGNYNLIRVSSILPVGLSRSSNITLIAGSPLHVAYAEISTNNPGKLIATAVSVGIPTDKEKIGVIMEYSAYISKGEAIEIVESMVEEAMNNRGYKIDQLVTSGCSVISSSNGYTTAFSGLAMW